MTQLGFTSFDPPSVGCDSNVSSIFRAFAVSVQLCLVCVCVPVWAEGSGLLASSAFSALGMLFRIRPTHVHFRAEPRSS